MRRKKGTLFSRSSSITIRKDAFHLIFFSFSEYFSGRCLEQWLSQVESLVARSAKYMSFSRKKWDGGRKTPCAPPPSLPPPSLFPGPIKSGTEKELPSNTQPKMELWPPVHSFVALNHLLHLRLCHLGDLIPKARDLLESRSVQRQVRVLEQCPLHERAQGARPLDIGRG